MSNTLKRLFIGFLVSIFIFNATAFAYDDVPSNSPYFYSIEYLRRNDVFPAKKYFKPDIIISKAEFIKYLALLNNPELNTKKKVNLPYKDTQNAAWYAAYLDEAIKLGILSGNEQKIEPYKKLTIPEALMLLFNSRSIPIPKKHIGKIPYKDVAKNKWVQAIVMRGIELGIVEPEKYDYFGLYRKITRAKAVHMIYKMDLVSFRPSSSQTIQSYDPRLEKIITAWELINSNFVDQDKLDKKNISDSAIRAMVETLEDPYSVFLDETQNEAFSDEFDGTIEGIGAFVAIDEDGSITIVAPIKDSPAFHAGIKAGDIIVKVDDFETEGATLYETVNRIKGPKGTKVKLTLMRNGLTVVIEVVRDVIIIKPIEYEYVGKGDIIHIKLLTFNENATTKFRELTEIITQNPKIKGIILDVRNNPGGLLSVAIDVLGFFLPKGTSAMNVKYNFFNYMQSTLGNGELEGYPLVVLVNKGSASASEIVAGALKEHDVAEVIGETTFGKGTVQEFNYFGDNSSLKLTVAKWLTPNLKDIQDNGIDPDIEVKDGPEGTDYPLDRAVLELNRIIR